MTGLVQFVPQVSVSQLLGFAERGEVITEDGEVLSPNWIRTYLN